MLTFRLGQWNPSFFCLKMVVDKQVVIHIREIRNSEAALQRPHYSITQSGMNLSNRDSFDRHLPSAKPCTVHLYLKKSSVCLFVCLLFIGHTTFVHFAALPPSPRAGAVVGGPARAGKHAQREHARACRTTSQRKNRTLMPFKTKPYARASCRIRNCRDFQKREKENQHATSQVQVAVCLLLECLLFESY